MRPGLRHRFGRRHQRFCRGSSRAPAVAIFALLCGAACYAISFRVLARRDSGGRNFYTYSTFAILLVLVGCRILLSGGVAAIAWSFLALACIGPADTGRASPWKCTGPSIYWWRC